MCIPSSKFCFRLGVLLQTKYMCTLKNMNFVNITGVIMLTYMYVKYVLKHMYASVLANTCGYWSFTNINFV